MLLSTNWTKKILDFLENNKQNDDNKNIDLLCAEFENDEKSFLKAFYRINDLETEMEIEEYILYIFQPTFKNLAKHVKKIAIEQSKQVDNFKVYFERSLVNQLNVYRKKESKIKFLDFEKQLDESENTIFAINILPIIKYALENNKITKSECKIYFGYLVYFLEEKIVELAKNQNITPKEVKISNDEVKTHKVAIMKNAKILLKNQSNRADGTVNNQVTECIDKMGEYILTEKQEIINEEKKGFKF